MSTARCILLAISVTLVSGMDLGPSMRIAQCRSLCLRRNQENGDCRSTPDCFMCWETCSLLENDWTVWGSVCQDDEKICFPGCKMACAYHATRVEEEFLPSTLPAPLKGPVTSAPHEVAIVFRNNDEEWQEVEQRAGNEQLPLNKTTWIIVVAEDGVRQYSGDFWTPNLETLKEGPLFEANLSWRDNGLEEDEDKPDAVQQEIDDDIVKLNSKMTLDFENDEVLGNALRTSGFDSSKDFDVRKTEEQNDSTEKIKSARNIISSLYDGKARLYFAFDTTGYFDEGNVKILADVNPDNEYANAQRATKVLARGNIVEDVDEAAPEERPEIYKEEPSLMETTSKNTIKQSSMESVKQSYIVSWEPETGGLMGNQLTDTTSAQISLLPGTKYLVRIASNDGPGSFALEVDTRTNSVEYAPLEAVAARLNPWAIIAGCTTAVLFMSVAVLVKICRRNRTENKLENV